ncbi:MAG: tripartite tricarboxylate transporter TctB family protein [Deltaproteobacteria bacterium]|nr:tripartite tricarboxylate transporter TctB family protein [Deltaproteobacteria bacterium]
MFAALGILIFVLTLHFPSLEGGHPGPSLFPRILAILFIFFGVIVIWRGWRSANVKTEESPAEEETPPNKFNPILVIILIAGFIVLAPIVGFFIAGTVLLAILMLRLGVSIPKSVIVSILLAAFIYTVFSKGLRVPLPIGYLGW